VPSESEGGILLVLDFDQCVQHHRAASVYKECVGLRSMHEEDAFQLHIRVCACMYVYTCVCAYACMYASILYTGARIYACIVRVYTYVFGYRMYTCADVCGYVFHISRLQYAPVARCGLTRRG
jgi:hypothetical protein